MVHIESPKKETLWWMLFCVQFTDKHCDNESWQIVLTSAKRLRWLVVHPYGPVQHFVWCQKLVDDAVFISDHFIVNDGKWIKQCEILKFKGFQSVKFLQHGPYWVLKKGGLLVNTVLHAVHKYLFWYYIFSTHLIIIYKIMFQ